MSLDGKATRFPESSARSRGHLIEYLKTPPSGVMLKSLVERMGAPVRAVLGEKGTP